MKKHLQVDLNKTFLLLTSVTMVLVFSLVSVQPALAANGHALNADKARIFEHWTRERIDAAMPRDLVIDPRGLGYLRRPDGSLQPYGHQISAEARTQDDRTSTGKPSGGSSDETPPSVGSFDPPATTPATVINTSSYTFSATVSDDSGIKSVSFSVAIAGGVPQKFTPNNTVDDRWELTLYGFTDGDWSWYVEAKDGAGKGGNSITTDAVSFTVDLAGSGSVGGDGTITNSAWNDGGAIQTAAGRIFFEMPDVVRRRGRLTTEWQGYVCSGTVVYDGDDFNIDGPDGFDGRSVILTAAHCVYDDVNGAFARNVMFIPDQAGTTGSGTDGDCTNDPLGCWFPSFGVVDQKWTAKTFPDNIAWDYAYYVVDDDPSSHQGVYPGTVLDAEAGDPSIAIDFMEPVSDAPDSTDYTHALGYSYSDDPNFMYCAEDMTTEGDVNWWLDSCGLSGGASGGPWIQPMDMSLEPGTGPIISVNSWGYTTSAGMAGPKLNDNSASCLFSQSKETEFNTISSADGDAGVVISYDQSQSEPTCAPDPQW
ncbi:MAG: hypothetical protein V7731_00320 [Amphritea sp.]